MTPTIIECAEALRRGELVVIPTETVYGLAADAKNAAAVGRIFSVKGRPATNPLIVHVAGWEKAELFATIPDRVMFQRLAEEFWPGPLTLVLPKQPEVPDVVTAGLATVGIRVPRHPIARSLLQEFGGGLAAPSANRFTEISPTRVDRVSPEIAEQCFALLDGGPCVVGIESTVLSLVDATPVVLRQGLISAGRLSDFLGSEVQVVDQSAQLRSPGQYPRHYAPHTPVEVCRDLGDRPGLKFGEVTAEFQIAMPDLAGLYAQRLYEAMQQMDELWLDQFWIELPPVGPDWDAIHDRIRRATTKA